MAHDEGEDVRVFDIDTSFPEVSLPTWKRIEFRIQFLPNLKGTGVRHFRRPRALPGPLGSHFSADARDEGFLRLMGFLNIIEAKMMKHGSTKIEHHTTRAEELAAPSCLAHFPLRSSKA
jgi:hypothetical protein